MSFTSSTPQTGRSVDVAVIGAGTAGLAAYRAAKARGARAVVIEAGPYGTTCARVGCMPSKLLIAAADAAHQAREAGGFGVHTTVEVDGAAVMARVRSERDRFVGFVTRGVDEIAPEDRIRGRARFVAPGVLDVDGSSIAARAVVVATGSSPVVPKIFDAVREHVVVNDDLFDWETLPGSVAVFGAGVIGLELGQALRRLGVRTRIFGLGGRLGPLTDPLVNEAAYAALRAELPIDPDAKVRSIEPSRRGVTITWQDEAGETHAQHFEKVLVAAGRRANLGGLDLDRAGVALDARGRPGVDRGTLQWGASPIFVAGDANAEVPLLHEAADDGRIAGENAARFPDVHPATRRSKLAIAFCDPQIAIVGATHDELAQEGPIVYGEVSFDDQGRSRVARQNRGLARLYADPGSGRFLGAEIAGPRAEHLGHLLAWAHQQALTIDQMLAMPFYHPVVEEGIRTALRDASAKLKKAAPARAA